NPIQCSAIGVTFNGAAVQLQLGTTSPPQNCRVTRCQLVKVAGNKLVQGTAVAMMFDSTLFEWNSLSVTGNQIDMGAASNSVVFMNCQSADALAGSTGTVINYAGDGFSSLGCLWGGQTGMTAINFVTGGLGQTILGNVFNTFGTAVVFGAASGPAFYAA